MPLRSIHLPAFALLLTCLATADVLADEYSVTVDAPFLGSSVSRNKVSLYIPVNIDKRWEELSDKDQQVWREYTELTEPRVTPPFPDPNIRSLLLKMKTPDRFRTTENLTREDAVLLIVRIAADGTVTSVDAGGGIDGTRKELSQGEGVLAYVYSNALLSQKFVPAKLDGKPVASAFPIRLRQVTTMN